jgi:hypothetical protein
MSEEELEKRKKIGFLQAQGMAPLPRLASGTSVTPKFQALVYSILITVFQYRSSGYTGTNPSESAVLVWVDYFNRYADEIPYFEDDFRKHLKSYVSNSANLLDLLQYCARTKIFSGEQFQIIKKLLEQELIAFRFIGSFHKGEATLIPFSDEDESRANEVDYVELANFRSAQKHFLQAVEELKAGHYRGSVSESISGVESVIKSLTGLPGVTLGDGLKLLNKDSELHPALKKGLESIYGWTNSPNGMRHALSDEAKDVSEAEARYMLSACLAFGAWLKRTAVSAG